MIDVLFPYLVYLPLKREPFVFREVEYGQHLEYGGIVEVLVRLEQVGRIYLRSAYRVRRYFFERPFERVRDEPRRGLAQYLFPVYGFDDVDGRFAGAETLYFCALPYFAEDLVRFSFTTSTGLRRLLSSRSAQIFDAHLHISLPLGLSDNLYNVDNTLPLSIKVSKYT
jgi:hypothetical protein